MGEKWTFQHGGTWAGDFLPKLMPHQRQGTLDGACGFYCVSMILDYWEVCNPREAVASGRTSLRRFLDSLQQERPLFVNGLNTKQVRSVLSFFPATKLDIKRKRATGFENVKTVTKELVSQAIPGILAYKGENDGEGFSHYAVTVGTGTNSIFLMDPAMDASEGSLYNNYLRSFRKGSARDIWGHRVTSVGPLLAIYRETFEADESLWLPR